MYCVRVLSPSVPSGFVDFWRRFFAFFPLLLQPSDLWMDSGRSATSHFPSSAVSANLESLLEQKKSAECVLFSLRDVTPR